LSLKIYAVSIMIDSGRSTAEVQAEEIGGAD
jgi:hypothetical protein